MAYAVQQVRVAEDDHPTIQLQNSLSGFPNTFNCLLFSCWTCLGTGGSRILGFSLPNGSISIQQASIGIGLTDVPLGTQILNAHYNVAISNLFSHILISLDPTTQRAQVYVNDVAVALSSGGWTGSGPFNFGGPFDHSWLLIASGSVAPGSGCGDLWVSNTASFVDLSLTANRRKFINADLSPVDLGNTGSGPFGVQPPLFLTVRPGDSDPTHFVTNNGSGGAWESRSGTIIFEPNIGCVPPPPPPAPPAPPPRLAIDNVNVTAQASLLEKNLISLRWSDDRGHSWGSPVTQDIGEAGEYRTSLQWQRLAYARDRCFEISWSVPMRTALQGCWVDVTPAQS